uniref:BHLH domain-containing protein n=1 Tax=Suricata suricatta TaxID=37032 RepID=A0A673UH59_SURSU
QAARVRPSEPGPLAALSWDPELWVSPRLEESRPPRKTTQNCFPVAGAWVHARCGAWSLALVPDPREVHRRACSGTAPWRGATRLCRSAVLSPWWPGHSSAFRRLLCCSVVRPLLWVIVLGFDRRRRIRICCDELNLLVPFCNAETDKATTLQWTTAFLKYMQERHGDSLKKEFEAVFCGKTGRRLKLTRADPLAARPAPESLQSSPAMDVK